MKKLWSAILILCFFIASCSSNKFSTQGEITHAKLGDYYAVVQIDNKAYELRGGGKIMMQRFKDFYRDYYPKVTKQALTLHLVTNQSSEFTYSFFIESNQLDQGTRLELEKLYQAKQYQNQYLMVSFSTTATPYYYGGELEDVSIDKYKLEKPIPILITETTPFVATSGGQTLLMLTMPIWVPFMILFGLKV